MGQTTTTVYNLEKSGFNLDLQYNCFNDEYRKQFNERLLKYYRWYEICYQIPQRWKEALEDRLDLLFTSKFNKLYEYKLKEFNPLYNIEIHEEFEHDINSSGNSKSNTKESGNNKSMNINFNYPNEELVNGDFESPDHAQSGQRGNDKNDNTSISEDNSNNNTKETYKKFTEGSSAGLSFSIAMMQFHKYSGVFDLDMQIIKAVKPFFMTA